MISIVDNTGVERFLGNNEGPLRYTWTIYGDVPQAPMVPRSRWKELIGANTGPESPNLPYVHDQDGVGQCNCDATVAAIESVRLVQGLPDIKLSAADLYDRINGGADNGSMLEDGLKEAMERGVGTAETAGLIWRRGMKTAANSERARFRALQAFLCPTFDHCMSAVLEGFKLISGILWYPNYEPDQDGWLPATGRGRAGGHAVFGDKPTFRNSVYGIWHQNSWGERFGIRGRVVFPESAYDNSIGGWWAVRSVTDEGGDVPAPRAA